MLQKLIDFSIRDRFLIFVFAILALFSGIYTFGHLDIEAYPDPSPPIIDIITQNPNWSAEEIERQITVPLEIQLNGMPSLEHIRSISLFGLSDIKCYFAYGSDYFVDRQEALNRIQQVSLPAGIQSQLSPESPVGEIFRYQLAGDHYSLMELREAEDWILERKFKQVPGVIDVVSFGGPIKEFHVDLDPFKLQEYHLSVPQVMNAIAASNSNIGASYLDLGAQSYNVRGIGLFKSLADIENVVVAEKNNIPVYVRQLGSVQLGRKIPLGKVSRDNDSDIVEGIVLLRRGEKSLPALAAIREEVKTLNEQILPKGMRIVPFYDRTDLVHETTATVSHTLIGGMILVVLVLLAFMGNLRASLVVALSIPLSLLITFLLMILRGQSANLISLGAIDFGIIVDASVVMVENIYRHFVDQRVSTQNARAVTREAAREVSGPIFFSSLILVVAFLPLFTMTGVEGKVFGPMAVTYGFALGAALLLAFSFSPALSSLLLRPKGDHETQLMARARRAYAKALGMALSRPRLVAFLALGALVGTMSVLPFLGGEFMPKLEEGNIWVRATMPRSISFQEAERLSDEIRLVLKSFPEGTTVVCQLGRPDDGTDVITYSNAEYFIPLKPAKDWPRGVVKPKLVDDMDKTLSRRFPGIAFSFSQNVEDNVEEAMTGVKGENQIKVFGKDLVQLEKLAHQVASVASSISGIADPVVFSELGQPNLLVTADREALSRYGLSVNDLNTVLQTAVGSQAVTQVLDGDRRFDVTVRFFPQYRQSVEAIQKIPIGTPDGGYVPLGQVAFISKTEGASFVYREDNARYIPVVFNVRGRDLQSSITEANAKIKEKVKFPEGYYMLWTGEFQELQEAINRLKIIVPLSLLIIFFILYWAFRKLSDVLLIMGTVPLALIGGIFSLLITHTHFSVSAAVGFTSLFGVSVLEGVLLVSRINHSRAQGLPVAQAISQGCELRLRPLLMVAVSAALGLLPAAVSHSIGAQAQQPLARVVVGGMLTSALLILLVIPALYLLIHGREPDN